MTGIHSSLPLHDQALLFLLVMSVLNPPVASFLSCTISGVQKVRSYTESMWTLYLKRIRNRLRNIAAFFTTHASSFNDFTAFLSQILEGKSSFMLSGFRGAATKP
eukprot:scpid68999/ scgid2235/ 